MVTTCVAEPTKQPDMRAPRMSEMEFRYRRIRTKISSLSLRPAYAVTERKERLRLPPLLRNRRSAYSARPCALATGNVPLSGAAKPRCVASVTGATHQPSSRRTLGNPRCNSRIVYRSTAQSAHRDLQPLPIRSIEHRKPGVMLRRHLCCDG